MEECFILEYYNLYRAQEQALLLSQQDKPNEIP